MIKMNFQNSGLPGEKRDKFAGMGISRRKVLKWTGLATLIAAGRVAGGGEYGSKESKRYAGELGDVFKDGRYSLPELPYAYDALEPLYEQRTLRIHHTKHHAGYVKGLNATLEKLQTVRKEGDYSSIKSLLRALAFHGSGHILHALFWQSMKPGGCEIPSELANAMSESFGAVEAARAQFAAAAKAVEGSGWAVLAYEPVSGKLLILQVEKHQNLTVWGVVPLLVCDVWEHAYYLQYANKRSAWVVSFMKLANWQFAAARLAKAK